ncbi:putative sigma factor [[Clostridium] sordellii]|uniref:hypothetical protein n=1 Tax=Paraclostridium sordellii TaxID=1505 RepID=UPI0005DF3B42|nr:hypothetical protein [Paeniclostridium sordellii]CEO04842.1 putative sigma factor [[Clostridium] sordellii] [Paeniclostridium sordellii]
MKDIEKMEKELDKEELFSKVEGIFYNYESLKKEIGYFEEEIEFLKQDYIGCRSIEYSERVQTSANISSSIEKEILQKQKQIEILEKYKLKKERDLKRIERAKDNFNKEELEMFDIRYKLKIKDWKIYADKMNVGKDTYYSIRDNMIYKSMSIMYPFYNLKNTAMEGLIDF